MEEKEFNKLLVKTPELAPKMKACREAGCITLEEASALSGLDVETCRKWRMVIIVRATIWWHINNSS